MFLIRAGFWFSLVVAFIPVNPDDLQDGQRVISPMETVGIATVIASDVSDFCNRHSSTCETGAMLMSQMGIKAKEGAKIAYNFLDEQYGKPDSQLSASQTVLEKSVDKVVTSSLIK